MRACLLVFLFVSGAVLCYAADIHRFKRLTTFGKAPEKTHQQIGKGKECKTDTDCVVSYSSCINDKDGKKRCICEDGVYPVNGVCERIRVKRGYVPKGNGQTKKAVKLHQPCQSNNECIDGAECKVNTNATSPALMKVKVCLCSEDTVEEDGECSGCLRLQTSGWLIFLFGFISLVNFNQ